MNKRSFVIFYFRTFLVLDLSLISSISSQLMNQYTSISELLSSIGLESYLEAYDASDISLDICLTLSDQVLKDIDINSLGHRRKLLVTFAAISTAEALK